MRCGYKSQAVETPEFVWPDEPGISNIKKEKENTISNSKTPPPEIIKRKFVKYVYRLEYKFTKRLYATCYSQFDSPVEARGIYANQNFADKLHRNERRIQRHHYTVALPPELKQYHETLIELPGGWTHKYRVFVPGYNKPSDAESKDQVFSVPRDRMRQRGRIDCLITTAGKYADIHQRIRNWKSTHRDCMFYEIVKYKLFDDGLLERVE